MTITPFIHQASRYTIGPENAEKSWEWHRLWLIGMLILVILALIINPIPVAAQSIGDYFQINYDPVTFSTDKVQGSTVFNVTIKGQATCIQDLPVSVDEAVITVRIMGENMVNRNRVPLNTGYTITIKPFPSKEGETTEINQAIPLQFPSQAESGNYKVIGELVKGEVKVLSLPVDITNYLPEEQLMGSVEYIGSGPAAILSPSPSPEPTPEPPPEPIPAPKSILTPIPPEHYIPWWVWLMVTVAVLTTIANIVQYMRRRIG